MAVGDAYVFPGFLTPVLTQLFFPKPPITFLTCFCRGERRKYAGKKSRLNRGSNSQPPGHESDTLTTEPLSNFSFSDSVFKKLVSQGCQKVSCGIGLTLYHKIPTFNDLEEKAFWKHCGKRRKCWLPAFSSFPTMFSILYRTHSAIWNTFNLLSANAFNLDWSKILAFGKELKALSATKFGFLGQFCCLHHYALNLGMFAICHLVKS